MKMSPTHDKSLRTTGHVSSTLPRNNACSTHVQRDSRDSNPSRRIEFTFVIISTLENTFRTSAIEISSRPLRAEASSGFMNCTNRLQREG